MTTATESEVRYEGSAPGTEIWGMTQANFLVAVPGRHAKESATALTDAAAASLASELGRENTVEFRQIAAREVGFAYLEQLVTAAAYIPSLITVSVGFLEEHPEAVQRVKEATA